MAGSIKRAKATGIAARRVNREQEAKRRRKAALARFGVLGAFVAAGLGVILLNVNSDRQAKEDLKQMTARSCDADTKTDPGQQHVQSPTYTIDPPAGGSHLETSAAAGNYAVGQAPPDGQLVHSLEHGYVVLWYNPDKVKGAQLADVQAAAKAFERDTLVVPRTTMKVPVAATAWNRRLLCAKVEGDSLRTFISEYRNKGPEKVPH